MLPRDKFRGIILAPDLTPDNGFHVAALHLKSAAEKNSLRPSRGE